MQRILFVVCGLALALFSMQEVHAQGSRQNQGLPKVDYKVGRIQPLGQGLAVPVTNRGFVISPKTKMTVAIYELNGRRLLKSLSLDVPAMHPNQTKRVIFVPPMPRQPIMVRAIVDPGNQVAESNERNNQTASRH